MDSFIDITPPGEYSYYQAKGDNESNSRNQEEEYVQSLVNTNRVVVFSKSQCPHCDDSKLLLQNMGVQYRTVELDKMKEGKEVQNVLGQLTNARMVPRIFIDGRCVGGNSDLQSLNQSGVLKNLLKKD